MEKKEFIDEFMDRIYLIGSKDNGKYILTRSQAEQAASELYDTCFKTFNKLAVIKSVCGNCKCRDFRITLGKMACSECGELY